MIGHKIPLAAAGGMQCPEIGLVGLGKALLGQIGLISAVIADLGDEIAAHIAHFGIAVVGKDDLIPGRAIGALFRGDDPYILAPVEQDGLAFAKLHRAVGGAGAGADINGIVVDVGILADAAQHREHKAYQQERGQKNGESPLNTIRFCRGVCQEKAHPFCPAATIGCRRDTYSK